MRALFGLLDQCTHILGVGSEMSLSGSNSRNSMKSSYLGLSAKVY